MRCSIGNRTRLASRTWSIPPVVGSRRICLWRGGWRRSAKCRTWCLMHCLLVCDKLSRMTMTGRQLFLLSFDYYRRAIGIEPVRCRIWWPTGNSSRRVGGTTKPNRASERQVRELDGIEDFDVVPPDFGIHCSQCR